MSDEHVLEGSDAGERPLLSYRQSWLAWAGPVLMLLVCVALCVAGQRYMPEFFWIFTGVSALLVLCNPTGHRMGLPLGETFDGGEVLMGSAGDGFLWVEPGDLGLVRAGNKKED